MKKNWKIGYLIFLIIISLIYLYQRWSIIKGGNATILDILIGVIFFVLVLSPLFNEIKLFGFSFKTELKELKNDLRNEIISLRSEINNSISFNPRFDFSNLNSSELTKEDVEELIKRHNQSNLEDEEKYLDEISISNDTLELFKIRYVLESKLMEIGKKLNDQYPELNERFRSPTRVIWYLQEDSVIDRKLGNAFKHVYNTTSKAIHGESIHEMTLENVKELAPVLIEELNDIIEEVYP